MAPPLAVCLLFLSLSQARCLSIEEAATSSNSSKIPVQLRSQSAPYTITTPISASAEQTNVLFHLANGSRQLPSDGAGSGSNQSPVAWLLVSPNGTVVGHRLNLDIEKLLENLSNNNFTSEVRVDHEDPTQIVNITISSPPLPGALRDQTAPVDEMLLEELIMDSMPTLATGGSMDQFVAPVYRDNHRFEAKNKTLRPKPPQQEPLTPPPIRSAMEVVAENYTVRKVAEEANVFGLRLLHQVNVEKLGSQNLVQSPFAVYQGLGLLLAGAMGDTAKELDRVLLGVQSAYENQKLTHDPDRNRLMASFSDVLRQLQSSATHHLRTPATADTTASGSLDDDERTFYGGGTSAQHLIVANNLLFSPSAYEISQEFKQHLSTYFNQTQLTKIEVGSTESIQTINGWIRQATSGSVASLFDKRHTFDETNVMSLLSTSWLQQEWRDQFYKIVSPTRSGIRLKGQGRVRALAAAVVTTSADDRTSQLNLLEFVDDNRQSHFVEYIKSEPTKNIHVYRSILSGQPVELVTVPFKDSNHRLIAISPIPAASQTASMNASLSLLLQQQRANQQADGGTPESLPDSSSLSRLISVMAQNPRKVMRSMWNIIAPDIITKQTLQQIQLARQTNITVGEQVIGANVIPLVQLSMPILRAASDSSLSAAMNHIGLVNTFDPYQANFIGINGHPFNYYKLHLSNVLYKTTFNMNERGINYDRTIRTLESMRIHPNLSNQRQKANELDNNKQNDDSSTTVRMEFVDDIKLDRPFVYMICDMRTKLVLYTGTMRNPTQTHQN